MSQHNSLADNRDKHGEALLGRTSFQATNRWLLARRVTPAIYETDSLFPAVCLTGHCIARRDRRFEVAMEGDRFLAEVTNPVRTAIS